MHEFICIIQLCVCTCVGVRLCVCVCVCAQLFEIKMTMSPFKILDLISVSGKDAEEGPLFHLQGWR